MGFDLGNAISGAINAVGKAVSDVEHDVEHAVNDAMNSIAHLVPPELAHYVSGIGDAIKWCGQEANGIAKDVGEVAKLAGKVPWGDVIHAVEAGVSCVPVIGTAVSDVLATAEVVVSSAVALIGGKDPLEVAIRTGYTYALASVPGAAALRLVLDTTVDSIVRMAVSHENPTSALVHALVDDCPDSPKFGELSPRSVASSLVKVVISHRPLVDVGVDLVAEATGAAGPVAERCVRAVAQCASKGFQPSECVHVALDIAPIPAEARRAWDDVRAQAKALGANLLPEDLAAMGAYAHEGVEAACAKALGAVGTDATQTVARMFGQGRDHDHVVEVMGGVDGLDKASVDAFVATLPVDRHATAQEIQDLATRHTTWKGHAISHTLPSRFVASVVAAETKRTIHTSIKLRLSGLASPTPLDVLRAQLEAIR
jgi:hypothetical protein